MRTRIPELPHLLSPPWALGVPSVKWEYGNAVITHLPPMTGACAHPKVLCKCHVSEHVGAPQAQPTGAPGPQSTQHCQEGSLRPPRGLQILDSESQAQGLGQKEEARGAQPPAQSPPPLFLAHVALQATCGGHTIFVLQRSDLCRARSATSAAGRGWPRSVVT